ncbi:glycosyltransferase [Lachnoclostridium sp. An131]|uniref:glycosyltransferase n=1 Tax=Lachnoclostridium sp. An131 TaxID=1965555 RepID=UPI0013A62DC4|nr:glycosyltransferase [Lachnoclostridium sp. An131]
MKILITTDWYYPVVNGVVMSVLTLDRELRKRGHEVKILTLSGTCHSHEENDVIYMASVGAGCVYPQARVKIPAAICCKEELLEWKPDIIHSQCEFSTFPAARRLAAQLDVPVVHTCHTVYEEYTHYFSPRREWGRAFVRRAMLGFSERVSAMIAPSEKTKGLLEEYGVSCPVYVVPSGVELSEYARYRNPFWREKIRAKYSIDSETAVLLYVGRLAKEKSIEELLYCHKKTQGKGTVLMIAGDGPHRRELEKQVSLLGIEASVIFTGMIPHEQIGEYY